MPCVGTAPDETSVEKSALISYPLVEMDELFKKPWNEETETKFDVYVRVLKESHFFTVIRKPTDLTVKQYIRSASDAFTKLRRIVDKVGGEEDEEEH